MDVLTMIYMTTKNTFLENCLGHSALWVSKALENFLVDNVKKLLTRLRHYFKIYFTFMDDHHFAHVLDILYRRFHTFFLSSEKLPIFKHNSEFVIDICRDRCNHHFNNMVLTFDTLLVKYDERLKREMRLMDAFIWFQDSYLKIYRDVQSFLKHYIKPEFKYSRDIQFKEIFYPALIKEVFVKFMEHYLHVIPKKYHYSPAFIISLSKYTLQMSESGQISEASLSIQFKCLAKELLNNYVETRVSLMTQMLRNSIANKSWTDTKMPKRISPVIRRILDEFAIILREVQTFFYDSNNKLPESFNASDPKSLLSVQHYTNPNLDSNVVITQMLFRESPVYSKEVEFRNDSILSCIMKRMLKSLLELVRQKTFNRFGMQQIQVDVFCLQSCIMEKDFISLYDDIISSYYSRCFDPELMNPHVVSAILQEI
nr:vacuolar protein sorting-associated protein 51 homolog [Parasteatoda tepidariorum]